MKRKKSAKKFRQNLRGVGEASTLGYVDTSIFIFSFCRKTTYPKITLSMEHFLKRKAQKPEAGLLYKRLMLSSSFGCDQIYKYELYEFGHTLLCYLSRT